MAGAAPNERPEERREGAARARGEAAWRELGGGVPSLAEGSWVPRQALAAASEDSRQGRGWGGWVRLRERRPWGEAPRLYSEGSPTEGGNAQVSGGRRAGGFVVSKHPDSGTVWFHVAPTL